MARYLALMGKRVEVHYRAGDISLPATATLVADSGKSIFLEEHFHREGRLLAFRWEIPYPSIVRINECEAMPAAAPARSSSTSRSGLQFSDPLTLLSPNSKS